DRLPTLVGAISGALQATEAGKFLSLALTHRTKNANTGPLAPLPFGRGRLECLQSPEFGASRWGGQSNVLWIVGQSYRKYVRPSGVVNCDCLLDLMKMS